MPLTYAEQDFSSLMFGTPFIATEYESKCASRKGQAPKLKSANLASTIQNVQE